MTEPPDRWRRVDSLFSRALDVEPGARGAFLRGACPDATLRAEVEDLLAASEAAADAFADGAAAYVDGWERALDGDAGTLVGERLGPWRLVREVGRGGMGTVYLAERADGAFERAAAVKVLRRGLDTDDLLARFRAERAILAGLDHPGVARLLDGGAVPDGRPYLVLEYVEGEPITAYCDRRGLGVEARLRLFGEVCDAVAYAHRHLVVHRDLKPSNVLVAEGEGGAPRVKLLDFGVAKLLGGDEALTRAGPGPHTPAYAAPEQLDGRPVTTATDVFALGVLLYEFLAGRRPWTTRRVAHGDRPPPAPSAAADPALRRRLRGDLDRIALKALAADPERRYATAEAFGRDVRRHLAGETVEARAPTVAYRAGAFVRRHRVGVAASTLAAAALVAVAAVAVGQAERARAEAARAERARAFLVNLFRPLDPYAPSDEALGADVPMRAFLDVAAGRVERELADEPALRQGLLADLVGIHWALGDNEAERRLAARADSIARATLPAGHPDRVEAVCQHGTALGGTDPARAEAFLRECVAASADALGPDARETGTALHDLGYLLREQGRYDEAARTARRAVGLLRRAGPEARDDLATALEHLALALTALGRPGEAPALTAEAVRLKTALFGPDHPSVAIALTNEADALSAVGDYAAAAERLSRAVDVFEASLGPDHPILLTVRNNLGVNLWGLGRRAEAEAVLREVVEQSEAHHGEAHVVTAGAIQNLGKLVWERGRPDEAERLLHRAHRAYRGAFPEDHFKPALPLLTLATVALDRGDAAAAERYALEARPVLEGGLPDGHWIVAYADGLRGQALAAQGASATARPLLARACERVAAVPEARDKADAVCGALDGLAIER